MSPRPPAQTAAQPINAWLLMGDDASFPTPREQRESWASGRTDNVWTGPRQAQPGDLLFFYFMAPRKAVHFVARATSHPMFDPSIGVNALAPIDLNQWWIGYTPLAPMTPVPFKDLRDLMGGHLNLRGKPSHYLRPEVAAAMLERGSPRTGSDPSRSASFAVPVGDPDLPDPATADLEGWVAMADGPLKLEAQVEHHVVEPLLRLVVPGGSDVRWQKSYRIHGGGVPDYVILRGGTPTGVVEVKLGVRHPRGSDWTKSPDFRQVMRYSKALDVNAVLVDSNRIFLIHKGAMNPSTVLHRATMTESDLQLVGRHLADDRTRAER